MKEKRNKELLEIVKNNYEAIAFEFDSTRNKVLWPTLIEYANKVKSGESVLDVGCGNGRLLRAFDGKEVKYLGVDNSANLIEAAKTNIRNQQNEREFLVADILDLDKVKVNGFDWVYCIAVIHHLPSEELQIKALKNLKAKINNTGKIVLSVWRPWGNKKLVNVLLKTIWLKITGRHKYGWNDLVFEWKNNQSLRYYHLFTRRELMRIIKKSGLELLEFHKEQRNYYLVLK